ncbi:MAG TPA: hydantoinase B/oxoprolinase family protein [Patescibacteria group bacterium]|jgi:N-methylhydantoinase B|nr:hydantoinase B/oxoprolinase family protein [Patescibacteria group bacterium]
MSGDGGRYDPVRLEVYRNLFTSVAEEMGVALQRSAYSPNIKERRDFSCALFDCAGRLIAQGDHMPVHLGSMPASVSAALADLDLRKGEMALLNDPFRGGTHLPDMTLVSPLHVAGSGRPEFYLANRAHHSDVGGMSAGSMPLATEIYQEGLRLPPVRFIKGGEPDRDLMSVILANVRTPEERVGDLMAQVAANRVGERRLAALVERHGLDEVAAYGRHLIDYAARLMADLIGGIPDGSYGFTDYLDDDGITSEPVPIVAAITIAGRLARIDFGGSAPQVAGPVNAVEAITRSAVLYAFRCLLSPGAPANDGCYQPLEIIAPEGTVVNARPPASVAGGNVETSQRIVDVLFGALAGALPDRIPAASSGTMNNLTFGGKDPRTGNSFAYYETIAGGMGARPGRDGLSGVHTHMTNSLNTPIEALELALPVMMSRYTLRRGTGGDGRQRGGDGIVREYRFLADAEVTLLADRRRLAPWGLAGGRPGASGRDLLTRAGQVETLPGKFRRQVASGDVLTIETPGGGGWGSKDT